MIAEYETNKQPDGIVPLRWTGRSKISKVTRLRKLEILWSEKKVAAEGMLCRSQCTMLNE